MAFGGGMGEAIFGSQMGNVLTKTTVVLAIVFLVNTTLLAMLSSRHSRVSVVDTIPAGAMQPAMPMPTGMPAGMPEEQPGGDFSIPASDLPTEEGSVAFPSADMPTESAPAETPAAAAPAPADGGEEPPPAE